MRRVVCVAVAVWSCAAAAAHAALPGPLETVAVGQPEGTGPSLAVTPAGEVYVAWAAKSAVAGWEVFVARRPVAGARSTPAPALDATRVTSLGLTTITSIPTVRVVALPTGGAALVAGNREGVWLWEIKPGGAIGAREVLAQSTLGINDVKVDSAGRVYVAHRTNFHFWSQRMSIRSPDGSPVSDFEIGGDEYQSGSIRLAVGSSGGIAVWAGMPDFNLKPTIHARRFTPVALSGGVTTVEPFGYSPDVALSPNGEATVTFLDRNETTTPAGPYSLYAARSGANDAFTNSVRVSSPTSGVGDAGHGWVTLEPSGTALVAFDQVMPTGRMAFFTRWMPAGNLLGPMPITAAGSPTVGNLLTNPGGGYSALLGVTDAQARLTPWLSTPSTAATLGAVPFASFPAGGPGASSFGADLDAAGDVVMVFQRTTNALADIGLTFLDAAAPTLGGVSVPASAVAGTPVAAGATATDIVGPTTTTWDFGDGSPASTATDHTYAVPGTYTVTARATDAAGNAAGAQRTINVTAPVVAPIATATPVAPPAQPAKRPTATPIVVVRQFKVAPAARGKRVVSLIAIGVEAKATVTVVCRKGCPKRNRTIATKKGGKRVGDVSMALKQGTAPAGAEVEVRVALAGKATRYARFKILGKLPFLKRLADGCTAPAGRSCSV